jgi:6-phosphogluconolactonase
LDERNVPQNSPDSNYLMAKTALFDPLVIRPAQVFAVETDLNPAEAAAQYGVAVEEFFGEEKAIFDLVLLGLGDNAHTASLFPHTTVLQETTVGIKEVWLPEQQVYRITMTAPLINQARNIAFLVYGPDKALAVQQILEHDRDIENYPAQLIAPESGHLTWFLDEAAASKLAKRVGKTVANASRHDKAPVAERLVKVRFATGALSCRLVMTTINTYQLT